MTPEELDDDTARPKAPPIPGLTPQQQASGQYLAAIHRMHLGNLDSVGRLMQAIREGLAGPASLAPALAELPMTQNLARFGTICGQECAMLQGHHDIEEYSLFPALQRNASPGLAAVIDRLIAEHDLIHHQIHELANAAEALARDPGQSAFDAVEATYAPLERSIRSHFGYEESQIGDALGAAGLFG
ncbi:hemerythrin domain-containing protein [Paracoccus sp. M683]|uniref:hemerythrin domain-containing protein n=1 Tax=Paracoccus sp. M683 TaxID=2594268 RepID=UPI0011814EAC|nr:hemerythrin domain-containing protein [Paracoccus sp. M683]TRW96791.1 hemerythrin domain-containing protein [Paracoccus sp. M683]